MRLIQGGAGKPPPDPQATLLAEQTERLARVAGLEQTVARLDADIADLEVQCIAADMALERAIDAAEGMQRPAAERAAAGELLARKAYLKVAMDGLLGAPQRRVSAGDAAPLQRLREAVEALEAWLAAPAVESSRLTEHVARVVLLIASVAAVWGAFAYHPAVLALLVPVAAPLAMLLNRGDDTIWRRLGAQQRFERSGHAPPATWESPAVRARLQALGAELRTEQIRAEGAAARVLAHGEAQAQTTGSATGTARDEDPGRSDDERYAALAMEQVEVEQMLRARLRRLGLPGDADGLTPAVSAELDAAAHAARTRSALQRKRAERTRIAEESAALRDAVWRVLNAADALQGDTGASLATLEAGLERLRQRTAGGAGGGT